MLTVTAAEDAPQVSSVGVTVTATAGTSVSSVGITLNVVDVTAPEVSGVVIDKNGRDITVTMDSPVMGAAGFSFFKDGSFRALSGAMTNFDGVHLLGQLATPCRPGSTVTWSYNPL